MTDIVGAVARATRAIDMAADLRAKAKAAGETLSESDRQAAEKQATQAERDAREAIAAAKLAAERAQEIDLAGRIVKDHRPINNPEPVEPDRPVRPGGFPRCDDPFCEPPSAPPELMPAMGGATTSSVRHATFVVEDAVADLQLRIDANCLSRVVGKDNTAILGTIVNEPCPIVRLGYLAGHVQTWTSRGTALGEAVHSLSLAPGESRNIAMIDWRRRQSAGRGETTDVSESLRNFEDHNRALSEVTRAVALEHQYGQTMTAAGSMATGGAFVAAGAVVGGVAGGLIGAAASGGTGTLVGAAAGGAAGVMAGGLVFAGANAIGMIQSESSGDREIVASAHQSINQSTQQQAGSIRSLWSTIVIEDAQDENIGVRSTNVTNYNHMHALNVEYFELLHRYIVKTSLERVEALMFIPFAALPEFDPNTVKRYWPTLRTGISEPWIDRGNQVFISAPPAIPEPPGGNRLDEPEGLAGYTLNMINGVFELPVTGDLLSILKSGLGLVNAAFMAPLIIDELFASAKLEVLVRNGAPIEMTGARNIVGDMAATFAGFIGGALGFDVPQSGVRFTFMQEGLGIPAADVMGLRITLRRAPVVTFPEQILRSLLGDGINYTFDLLSTRVDHSTDPISTGNTLTVDNKELEYTALGVAEDQLAWDPLATPRAGQQGEWQAFRDANAPWVEYDLAKAAYDRRIAELAQWKEEILSRLNAEPERFTRILLAQNPGVIAKILDVAELVERGGAAGSPGLKLYQLVDTTPVGVTEQAIVLRMRTVPRWKADLPDDVQKELLARYLDLGSLPEALVRVAMHPYWILSRFAEDKDSLTRSEEIYLPGQGLFAEAILGRANSAEYINLRRFWNWQDSPIPNQAPIIQPVQVGSLAQAPLNTDPNIPGSTLTQSGAPSFPDPQGLGAVLQAIQNGDMFRDMSKAGELTTIIGGLSELAGKLSDQAATMTGGAASDALSSATEIGKTAAKLAETFAAQANTITERAGEADVRSTGPTKDGPAGDDAVDDSFGGSGNGGDDSNSSDDGSTSENPPPQSGDTGGSNTTPVPAQSRPTGNNDVWKNWAEDELREALDEHEDLDAAQPQMKAALKKWYSDGLEPVLKSALRNHHEALGAAGDFADWAAQVLQVMPEDAELASLSQSAQSDLVLPALLDAYNHTNAGLENTNDLARDLALMTDLLTAFEGFGGEEHEPANVSGLLTDLTLTPAVLAPGEEAVLKGRIAVQVATQPPIYGQEFWLGLRSEELLGKSAQFVVDAADGRFEETVRISENRRQVPVLQANFTSSEQPNDIVVNVTGTATNLPMVLADSQVNAKGQVDFEYVGRVRDDQPIEGPYEAGFYAYNGETWLFKFVIYAGLLPLSNHFLNVTLSGAGTLESNDTMTNDIGEVYITYSAADTGAEDVTIAIWSASGNSAVAKSFVVSVDAY